MPAESTNKRTLLEFYRLFYNEKRYSDGARLLTDHFINHHHPHRDEADGWT